MSDNLPKTTIRLARDGDAPSISNVHISAWREAYKDLLPDDYLNQLPLTFNSRLKMWSKLIAERPYGQEIWVAESEKHGIVGFAAVSAARDEKFESFGELGAIYLLGEYHGAGIGYKLLSAAFNYFRSLNYAQAYCWVLADNPTLEFYQKTGGRLSGDSKTDDRGALKLSELAVVWDDLSRF